MYILTRKQTLLNVARTRTPKCQVQGIITITLKGDLPLFFSTLKIQLILRRRTLSLMH